LVKQYLVAHGGTALASFTEIESGKINQRPPLEATLLRCRLTHSTLLMAKLDRLSGNAAFLLNLKDASVKFQALDLPEVNTLTLGVLAVIAQHEGETISARTKAASAAAKLAGFRSVRHRI
jgi:DNA invertase Pin-like site-specific DNA recombinase